MNLVGAQGSTVWRHIHWYTKDGMLSDIKRSPTLLSDTLYPTPIHVFKLFQQRSMVWVPATEEQRTWLAPPPPPQISSMEHHPQNNITFCLQSTTNVISPPHPPHPPRYPPWNIIHKTTSPLVCNQQRTWLAPPPTPPTPPRYHPWNIIYKQHQNIIWRTSSYPKKAPKRTKMHENTRADMGRVPTTNPNWSRHTALRPTRNHHHKNPFQQSSR